MRVGILELLIADVDCDVGRRFYCRHLNRQYASIMPQAVSVWCRQLGHETFYATYWGQADPKALLPADLDVVFLTAYTQASALASALAALFRRDGALTVLGGPHAKAFPADAIRFFDLVVRDCDRTLIEEILEGRPRGLVLSSSRRLRELPSVEERLPEIERAHFRRGRATSTCFIPMLSSLGCPYACDFCTDWDNPYRTLPLDRFEADLRFVSERFPRAKIPFHDPNFAVKFDAVLSVMERIPRGARNAYVIQTSLSLLGEAQLRRLRDTNCVYLAPGVEAWGDYSNKAKIPSTHGPSRKLAEVVAHFEQIRRYVPGLQANFLFGVDSDAGAEPVELTLEFMDRLPEVWPNVNIPMPFGGTPLYEEHLAAGRILSALPFAFYYFPYLVTTLANYTPLEYYDHLIRLFSHAFAPRTLARRAGALTGIGQVLHALRLVNARRNLVELRAIRQQLRNDEALAALYEGKSEELPAFYRERLRRMLGRYAELLSPEDLRPRLEPTPSVQPDLGRRARAPAAAAGA